MIENNTDKHAQLFFGLVTSLSTQAWIQLGKIKNPVTDKIERDLTGASVSIDMLDMLKVKMSGNLTKEENTLLTSTIRDLKMNYVDELSKPRQEEKDDEEKRENENDRSDKGEADSE